MKIQKVIISSVLFANGLVNCRSAGAVFAPYNLEELTIQNPPEFVAIPELEENLEFEAHQFIEGSILEKLNYSWDELDKPGTLQDVIYDIKVYA